MRISGNVLHHTRYSIVRFSTDSQNFSHRILGTKVFLAHVFGNHDGVRILQCCGRIAAEEGERKNLKKRCIGKSYQRFLQLLVLILYRQALKAAVPGKILNFRIILSHRRPGRRHGGRRTEMPADVGIEKETVNTVRPLVKAVIAQLIQNPEHD